MKNKRAVWIGIGALAVTAALLLADEGKRKLREALRDPEPSRHWIYDDIYLGIAQAKKAGKPLLVVFR